MSKDQAKGTGADGAGQGGDKDKASSVGGPTKTSGTNAKGGRAARRQAARSARSTKKKAATTSTDTAKKSAQASKPASGTQAETPDPAVSEAQLRASAAAAQELTSAPDVGTQDAGTPTSQQAEEGSTVVRHHWPHHRQRHRVTLTFFEIPANTVASVQLREPAAWALGSEMLLGSHFQGANGDDVNLQALELTRSLLTVTNGDQDSTLTLQLFIAGPHPEARGSVTLPPGAWLVLQSSEDQTQLLNFGSWALTLGS
ncbi:MAG: hypothetical protein AAGD01_16075 [Acidobacteriota bacterium]